MTSLLSVREEVEVDPGLVADTLTRIVIHTRITPDLPFLRIMTRETLTPIIQEVHAQSVSIPDVKVETLEI